MCSMQFHISQSAITRDRSVQTCFRKFFVRHILHFEHRVKLLIHLRSFHSQRRCLCNQSRVCEQFVANHLQSVFSTNTKDVRSLVGTVFVLIFVLFHVCRKIFLSRQQILHNCWQSQLVRHFPMVRRKFEENKFSEQVCEHNVHKCIRSFRFAQSSPRLKNQRNSANKYESKTASKCLSSSVSHFPTESGNRFKKLNGN